MRGREPAAGTGETRSPERHRSPTGEEFVVLRRAGPVAFDHPPHVPAEAGEELLVVKSERLFLCAHEDGDVRPTAVTGEGLYFEDTRHLSELQVRVNGTRPVLLSRLLVSGHEAVVDATNATLHDGDGDGDVPQKTVNVRRTLIAAERLYCVLRLRSFNLRPVVVELDVDAAADFADMFEVRGAQRRDARGRMLVPKRNGDEVTFAYAGEDDEFRETLLSFDPAPDRIEIAGECARAHWTLTLEQGAPREILVAVEPARAGMRAPARTAAEALAERDGSREAFERGCTRIATDRERIDRVLDAGLRDVHALLIPVGSERITAAGVPWYVAPFGRDSLIAALELLIVQPQIARATLSALAGMQAVEDDAWRDAEPGKIPHEQRSGELARGGFIPHTPYYGTVDATPLFLVLAAAYHRWTADLDTIRGLRPALDAALAWIDLHGDRDGDGFVEYERRSPSGLLNHGWKDSDVSVVHADGSLAEGPIALVEVQGYVYAAKRGIAEVYAALGEHDRAAQLRDDAARLRAAFNDAFWDPDEGYLVLALDGAKRQVRSVASNPAHCLWCGIVDEDKASRIAERLMAPDMFSGWGIRTLSSTATAYNPMSYHNGSVWPHDNALAAAGLRRYGFSAEAARIAAAMFDVGAGARDHRLPELFCGFGRDRGEVPVAYPVACIPQAWAAAAPFLLLQSVLGIDADPAGSTLTVTKPLLPEGIGKVELRDVRVGRGRASISFRSEFGATGLSLLGQEGGVRVTFST